MISIREIDHIVLRVVDLERMLAFFRSVLHIGVLGRERFQYWYLLAWTLVRRPRLFSQAVTLAISGWSPHAPGPPTRWTFVCRAHHQHGIVGSQLMGG